MRSSRSPRSRTTRTTTGTSPANAGSTAPSSTDPFPPLTGEKRGRGFAPRSSILGAPRPGGLESEMAGVGFDRIGKVYTDGTRAVRDLTLSIPDGEFMVLVGPSGCGKT